MSTLVKNPRGQNVRKPWTVRYVAGGTQREKSFEKQQEARDFRTALDYDIRSGNFTDPKAAKGNFGEACEVWISRLACAPRSRDAYRSAYRMHVKPVLGSRTLGSVAADRDAVSELLTITMAPLSVSPRRQARMIITGALDEAVRAGVLPRHRCGGIPLADAGPASDESFDATLFPTFGQVQAIAERAGISVWLMRACGVRIQEALAVEKSDFIMGGRMLRVSRQATRDGRAAAPCKKRKSTREFRTVPVPAYLWAMVKDLPDGPLVPGNGGRLYQTYASVAGRFATAAKAAKVDASVTPHWLRHQFASVLLGAGVPVGDVSEWLGHRDLNTTFSVYRSVMPDAPVRAASVLDAEFAAAV